MTPLEETLKQELLNLQKQNAALISENQKLKAPNLESYNGLLWKRIGPHYEAKPYCPECPSHPVMSAQGGRGSPRQWVCPNGHSFQRSEGDKPEGAKQLL